ncbi:MAG: DUF2333 family protein [Pseudomonadota bacterium]
MFWRKHVSGNQEGSTRLSVRIWTGVVLLAVLGLLVWCLAVMILNYRFPDFFAPDVSGQKKPGVVFTATLIRMSEDMMENWLPNDVFYPTVFLDNPQNFQRGELEAVRYTVRVMRDKISRLRTTDKIDKDAEGAFVLFSNDPEKWILPSAESKYKAGIKALKRYEARLNTGEANFFPRADNLNELLDQYISLLGGVNTRLSNAPRDQGRVLTTETAGDKYMTGEKYVTVHVPWLEVDNNFYYAQGVAYGLREMMAAVQYDFKHILEIKKATELLERIIHLLNLSQFEPIFVLNGARGSIFANHSTQLQSLLEDARQKMRSLQDMVKD